MLASRISQWQLSGFSKVGCDCMLYMDPCPKRFESSMLNFASCTYLRCCSITIYQYHLNSKKTNIFVGCKPTTCRLELKGMDVCVDGLMDGLGAFIEWSPHKW